MKSKWYLAGSIIQMIIGVAAIISFIILYVGGEITAKWIVTLLLAIAFVVIGIIDIIAYKKAKDKQ